MPSSKKSSKAGKPGSGSSRTPAPSSSSSTSNQARRASSANYTHQRQSSSSYRPLRTIAPKPRPASPGPVDEDKPAEEDRSKEQSTLVSASEPSSAPPEPERPRSPSIPPPVFIAWKPRAPSSQPQPAADDTDDDEAARDLLSLVRPSERLPVRPRSSNRSLPPIDTGRTASASPQRQQYSDQATIDQVVLPPLGRARAASIQPVATIAPSLLSLTPEQKQQRLLQATAQAVIDEVALGRPRSSSNQLPPFLAPSLLCSSPQPLQSSGKAAIDRVVLAPMGRPRSQSFQPPPTIAPSLLSLSPQQQQSADQIPIDRVTVASASTIRTRQPSGRPRGRPRHSRSQSWSTRPTRPLRTLLPKPDPSSSPPPPQFAEPSLPHDSLASRLLLSPLHTAVSAPSPARAPTANMVSPIDAPTSNIVSPVTAPPTSNTVSPITQAPPPPPTPTVSHPFWGPAATEVLPCDEEGTIRDAYKRARLQEVEDRRRRHAQPPYWTVRHIQEVCTDIHRMPAPARAGFGDLHKQVRELYDFHAHVMGLYPPPWAHPDDMVAVEGTATVLPRVLRDFVLGMSEHLLGAWRPFSRARPAWNVHSTHTFLEDFSCFLLFHNKFYGQQVIPMQAPLAPGWAQQGALRFFGSIPFRGYREREEMGLTKYETERKSFVDCFWDN